MMGWLDALSAIAAAMRADMAQWCVPWRRQQAGRPESCSAFSVAATGPRPKRRTKKIEKARRIWEPWYTTRGICGIHRILALTFRAKTKA
jgi:hypothetical protein